MKVRLIHLLDTRTHVHIKEVPLWQDEIVMSKLVCSSYEIEVSFPLTTQKSDTMEAIQQLKPVQGHMGPHRNRSRQQKTFTSLRCLV